MEWTEDLFEYCYLLGFKGSDAPKKIVTEEQAQIINQVLLSKENFTFSELERIGEQDWIWVEITEDFRAVEHTKLSIILGIIGFYNRGVEFKHKSQNNNAT